MGCPHRRLGEAGRCFLASAAAILTFSWLTGCAFDLVHVRQSPAHLNPDSASLSPWTLNQQVKIHIGTTFATVLRAGTRWEPVGRIEQGGVFKTHDQIVQVEASNIHEAYVVVEDARVVGFYLPVERTFSAAKPPVAIPASHSQSR